jgi:ATP-dependent DNA helicase RecG
MQEFKANKIQILVSTSVIEVGIDIPNATIMMIEGADRFGLAQLHQFRGRVGRAEHQSYCFLFTDNDSEKTLKRLSALIKSNDGFKLAEYDLKFRGPGEVYGIRQSGMPDFKIASLNDLDLINLTKNKAKEFLNQHNIDDFTELKVKLDEIKIIDHLE